MAGINPGVGGGSSSGTTIITDGSNTAIKATVFDLTDSNPLVTALVDANGDQITSFGGGTQYADGAVRGTATGTLGMVDDGVNIQSMKGDSSGRPLITVDTALPAGTAIIGKVGIDQTTPGTTNLVAAGQSGTWNIGTLSTITNVVHVDDNGGSLTVDNNGTFAVQAALVSSTNAGATVKTFDFDSSAGTDTVTAFGVAVAASGGAVAITGDVTNGLDVDVTRIPATTNAGATVKTFDFDSGAGTDTVTAFGLAVAASGGAAAITGDTANGLDVDVTRVSGTVTVQNTTPVALTASSPGTVSVGVSSASAVASNSSRKGLTLVNLSNSYIYLAFSNGTAVVNSGVALSPNGGSYEMSPMTFTTGQVNAIADAASSTLAFQEWT